MDVNSKYVEILNKMNEKIKSEEITDLELEVKIEKTNDEENIKSEFFEKTNYSEPIPIIGEKRKNQEISNLENKNKKIKEEFVLFTELYDEQIPGDKPENEKITEKFVVFEKLDNQQEVKQEIEEIEEIGLTVICIIYIFTSIGTGP
jgi:hypothetical protein